MEDKQIEKKEVKDHYNKITIADFEIETTTETLDHIVMVMKDLIEHYTKFSDRRAEILHKRNSMGVVGVG